MKPRFERVTLPAGCSIRVYNRLIPDIPFEWHHHPEYELTLTLNSAAGGSLATISVLMNRTIWR